MPSLPLTMKNMRRTMTETKAAQKKSGERRVLEALMQAQREVPRRGERENKAPEASAQCETCLS
jgi:hypothetical protein